MHRTSFNHQGTIHVYQRRNHQDKHSGSRVGQQRSELLKTYRKLAKDQYWSQILAQGALEL